MVILIEKEVSYEPERATSLANALAKDINENFQISGTKAVYVYADITTNARQEDPPYAFCILNLPNRVAQELTSTGLWRSKHIWYPCFPLGQIPQTFPTPMTS